MRQIKWSCNFRLADLFGSVVPGFPAFVMTQINPLELKVQVLQDHLLGLPLMAGEHRAQVLMPLITRELIYRLLMGEQGARLRHLASMAGYTPDIARAVERLRTEFNQPLRVEQIAR